MKNSGFIVTLVLVFCISTIATAQIGKGGILVGAKSELGAYFGSSKNEYTVDGTTTENDGPSTTQFNFTPQVGYFFMDGFAGGLFVNFDVDNSKTDQELESGGTEELKDNTSSVSFGPFFRYYLDMDQVKPFAEVSVGIGSVNYKYDYLDYDYSDPFNPKITVVEDDMKYNTFNWGIGAGAAFFVTDGVSIDAMVGYKSGSMKYEADNGNESKNKYGKFGVNVGFTVIIPAK